MSNRELSPAQTLAFFRSVILSGEKWTDACQQAYDAAIVALVDGAPAQPATHTLGSAIVARLNDEIAARDRQIAELSGTVRTSLSSGTVAPSGEGAGEAVREAVQYAVANALSEAHIGEPLDGPDCWSVEGRQRLLDKAADLIRPLATPPVPSEDTRIVDALRDLPHLMLTQGHPKFGIECSMVNATHEVTVINQPSPILAILNARAQLDTARQATTGGKDE